MFFFFFSSFFVFQFIGLRKFCANLSPVIISQKKKIIYYEHNLRQKRVTEQMNWIPKLKTQIINAEEWRNIEILPVTLVLT